MSHFDAQLRSDGLTGEEVRNLRYFGTTSAVTTADASRAFERADELLTYLRELATTEVERLRAADIAAYAALGVLPSSRPRRAHPEVWRDLPDLLELPHVVAVGEIGAWEDTTAQWKLFDRQVKIGMAAELPLIVTPPRDLVVNMTYKMMQRLERLGATPRRCLMNRVDARTLEAVASEGFVAGLSVGYRHVAPRDAAVLVADLLEQAPGLADRIVLSSSIQRDATDILGIAKTASALADSGVDEDTIVQLISRNAASFYLTNSPTLREAQTER